MMRSGRCMRRASRVAKISAVPTPPKRLPLLVLLITHRDALGAEAFAYTGSGRRFREKSSSRVSAAYVVQPSTARSCCRARRDAGGQQRVGAVAHQVVLEIELGGEARARVPCGGCAHQRVVTEWVHAGLRHCGTGFASTTPHRSPRTNHLEQIAWKLQTRERPAVEVDPSGPRGHVQRLDRGSRYLRVLADHRAELRVRGLEQRLPQTDVLGGRASSSSCCRNVTLRLGSSVPGAPSVGFDMG